MISKISVIFLMVLGISFSNVPYYVLSGMIEGYIKTANIVDRAWHLSKDDNVVDKFTSYRNLASKIQVREALAAAQGDGIALYAKNTNDGVYARTFTAPSTVSGETNILTGFTDTIRYIELKASPTRDEMIAVVQAAISTTGSTMVVLKWNGASWTVPFCIRTGGGTIGGTSCTNATYISNANTVRRAVAIEYENTSGDAMVLYSSGASGTNEMKYQTWNGSAWSGELNLDTARLTGVVTWIELVPKPASNEMTALIVDSVNRDLSALVWDGTSAWGTEPAALLEAEIEDIGVGTNPTVRPFDGAYESSSGDFLAAWGYSIAETEATEVRYVTRASGGAWGSVVTPTTWPEIATIVDMAGDPDSTSNYIVHASQDPAAGDNQCAVWSGTAWPATPANCDINAGAQIAGNQGFGVGFLKSNTTKRAIVVWPEAASASLNYYSSDPAGNTWATAAFAIAGATSAITTPVEVVQDPFNTNILMATVQKGTGIHMLKLSMDATPAFTWSNPLGAALGTSPTTGLYQPFSFAFNRLIPAITTLSTGTNPGNSTIAPGGGITSANGFTLTTSAGTDPITSITVNLSTNSGVGTLTITNGADTVLGSIGGGIGTGIVTGSNAISIASTDATTGGTAFKVKVTPLSHANMPVPDGGAYAITGAVTDWAGTNTKAGQASDTSDTVTIDNDSPAGTTVLTPTAGDTQVTLSWTNPGDSDFQQVYIYCKTSSLLSGEAPTEGTDPATDPAACDATARLKYKGTVSPQTITGLTNGTLYYFRVYGRDTNGNFTAYTAAQQVSATPVAANNPPALVIDNPPVGNTNVAEGANYTIQYDLSDTEDVALVDFYYDTNSDGVGGTAIAACQDQGEGTNATCAFSTNILTVSTPYYIYGIATDGVNSPVTTVSSGTITVNDAPTLTVTQPDGVGDTVTQGQTYTIYYDLADTDSVVTVDLYYDVDGVGLNGTAIAACSNLAEGTNMTCSWDTTGVPVDTYFIYGRDVNDTVNAEVTDYSPGEVTVQASTVVTVNEIGTQTSPLSIPSTGNYIGGAFTMLRGSGSANVTSITITESGTVDALTNLNNIKLQYDLDTVAPYDCNSVGYNAGDTQYGATDTNGFSAADGTSAFTGSVAVSDVQAMCVYVVLDVLSGASDGQTMIVRITNPSTDVAVSAGTVSPATPQGAGTTNLEVPKITVGTFGSQQDMTIGTGDNNVGGAFTFVRNTGTANVTQIVISDLNGTVNANLNLSDVVVFYKQEDPCSASIPGDATQFNSTGVGFDASENATVGGTMAVGTLKICVYVRLDAGDNVTGGQTLQIEITDPSAEVTVSAGSVTPATAVAIAGVTTFNAVTFTSFGMPFFYNSANWGTDGAGVTFFYEVYMRQTTGTVYARLLNETDTTAVTGSTLSTTSASFVRLRTSGLTMINGKTYRAQFGKIGADAGETLGAKLVINQNKTGQGSSGSEEINSTSLLEAAEEEVVSSSDESLFMRLGDIIISKTREALASLGLFIENGIATLEKLIAREIVVEKADIQEANIQKATIQNLEVGKKIQLVDQATNEIYCTWIEQGEWKKEKGECAETAPEVSAPEPTSTSETTESAAVESPPPVIESPSTEPTATESSSAVESSTTEPTATEPTATEPTATEPATTDSGSASESTSESEN